MEIKIKRCRVCGDKASGWNYSGLTCDSCKIFFLRNSSKSKFLKCLKNKNCEMDLYNRKNCPQCRLNKCYSIGMTKSPTDLKEKPKVIPNDPFNLSISIRSLLEPDTASHLCSTKIKIKKKTLKLKNTFVLTAKEQEIIAEVQNAMSIFENETQLKVIGTISNITDAFNWPSLYARRIIKFCKNIAAFKALNQCDQLIILKPFYIEILMIRFSFLWNEEKQGYPVIANETGDQALFMCMSLGNQLRRQDIAQYSKNRTQVMNVELENDPIIRDLIIAQLLFKSRTNLKCFEFIRYQYSIYNRILLRYLEQKYSNIKRAKEKYLSLITMLKDLDYLKQMSDVLMKEEIEQNKLAQIMIELFDVE